MVANASLFHKQQKKKEKKKNQTQYGTYSYML